MSRTALPITLLALTLAGCAPRPTQVTETLDAGAGVAPLTNEPPGGAEFAPLTYDAVELFTVMPRP